MKSDTLWILLANAQHATVYRTVGSASALEPVSGMTFENPLQPAREIMSDKQGRSFDSVGGGRHAMEHPSDPVDQQADEFAGKLAKVLQNGLTEGACDQVALVAGPKMLARLRDKLPSEVRSKIKAEVDKDYIKTPPIELPGLLKTAGVI